MAKMQNFFFQWFLLAEMKPMVKKFFHYDARSDPWYNDGRGFEPPCIQFSIKSISYFFRGPFPWPKWKIFFSIILYSPRRNQWWKNFFITTLEVTHFAHRGIFDTLHSWMVMNSPWEGHGSRVRLSISTMIWSTLDIDPVTIFDHQSSCNLDTHGSMVMTTVYHWYIQWVAGSNPVSRLRNFLNFFFSLISMHSSRDFDLRICPRVRLVQNFFFLIHEARH
jgi:hypothetical protein